MTCQAKTIASQIIDQSIPPKAQWSTDQIPDMTGKIVIVTGANTGLNISRLKVEDLHHDF